MFSLLNLIFEKSCNIANNDREAERTGQIAFLEKRNRELEDELREWSRMQATLSFRHLLEWLPPPSGKKEGQNWADFWKQAVDEAKKPGARNVQLARIVKDYRTLKNDAGKDATKTVTKAVTKDATERTTPSTADTCDHAKVRNVGAGLYGTLSDNIHHYTGYYELEQNQWDILQWKILRALTPLAENIVDGNVQWEKERHRFITPAEEPSTIAPEALPPTVNLAADPGTSSTAYRPDLILSSPPAT